MADPHDPGTLDQQVTLKSKAAGANSGALVTVRTQRCRFSEPTGREIEVAASAGSELHKVFVFNNKPVVLPSYVIVTADSERYEIDSIAQETKHHPQRVYAHRDNRRTG